MGRGKKRSNHLPTGKSEREKDTTSYRISKYKNQGEEEKNTIRGE